MSINILWHDFYAALYKILFYGCTIIYINPVPIEGHWGCCQFFTIMNSTAVNILISVKSKYTKNLRSLWCVTCIALYLSEANIILSKEPMFLWRQKLFSWSIKTILCRMSVPWDPLQGMPQARMLRWPDGWELVQGNNAQRKRNCLYQLRSAPWGLNSCSQMFLVRALCGSPTVIPPEFLEGILPVYAVSCCRCCFLEKCRTNSPLEIQVRASPYFMFI